MQTYKCLDCGATLAWNIKTKDLTCDYCGRKHTLADFGDDTTTTEEVASEHLTEDELLYKGKELDDGMVAYECKGCGGTVVTLKTTMAEVCPYCGETISITSKSVGDFRPKFVVPFDVQKEKAISTFRDYAKHAKYAPDQFRAESVIEKIQGLYTPYYLHSLTDRASHAYEGETQTKNRQGNYEITTHKVYSLGDDISATFEDIPLDASERIADHITRALKFDLSKKQAYNPAYMSGFIAEQADSDKTKISEHAETLCKSAVDKKSRSLFSKYKDVTERESRHTIAGHKFDYCMLPLWILSVKYQNQVYTLAVNGQDGKITGWLPFDKSKVVKTVLTRALVTEAAMTVIMMLARYFT